MHKFKLKIYILVFIPLCASSNLDYDYLEKLTYFQKDQLRKSENDINKLEKKIAMELTTYYQLLAHIINQHDFKKGCELGIPIAGSSSIIFNQTNLNRLYSIDSYQKYETIGLEPNPHLYKALCTSSEPLLSTFQYMAGLDILYYKTKNMLSKFNERSMLIRLLPIDAAMLFETGELDFIFLGFTHTYDYTMQNLHAWYDKVKIGGMFLGIYCNINENTQNQMKEFFKDKRIKVEQDSSYNSFWYSIKTD